MLGIFAVVMIFCPAVAWDLEEASGVEAIYGLEGLKTVFGWEMNDYEVFEFSFLQFLTYFLPLGAIVLLCYFTKIKNKNMVYVAIACFLVGAVLFFLSTETLQFGGTVMKKEIEDYTSIGTGAIIGGISCILAALCSWLHLKNEKEQDLINSVE